MMLVRVLVLFAVVMRMGVTVMMVMVSVMMMVMPRFGVMLHVALRFVAILPDLLKLQRGVAYTMAGKLLSDALLNGVRFSLVNYVHRGIIALPVHTPDVNVVNLLDSLKRFQMLPKLPYVDVVGRFFKEQAEYLFEV